MVYSFLGASPDGLGFTLHLPARLCSAQVEPLAIQPRHRAGGARWLCRRGNWIGPGRLDAGGGFLSFAGACPQGRRCCGPCRRARPGGAVCRVPGPGPGGSPGRLSGLQESALGSGGRALVLTLGNQPWLGRSAHCRRSEYRGIVGRERDRDELAAGAERLDDVS